MIDPDFPDFNLYPPEEPLDLRDPCDICGECRRFIVRFHNDWIICEKCLDKMTAFDLINKAEIGIEEDQGGDN